MEKILSKEEIADLLSAVRHGDIKIDQDPHAAGAAGTAGKSVKAEECNLFRADGPEGWKLPNFDLVLDSFAHNYAMSLSTRFQRAVSVKLDAMESMRFEALLQRDWQPGFSDPGTGDWREGWFVDGLRADIRNTPDGRCSG